MTTMSTKKIDYKPKRSLGNAVTRQRRKAKEQIEAQVDARRAAERDAALRELQRAASRGKDADAQSTGRFRTSLLAATARNQSAVMRSWGKTAPIIANVSNNATHINAYTDFEKVVVEYPAADMPTMISPSSEIADVVTNIKAIIQHEVGHLRFTLPYPQLCQKAAALDTTFDSYTYSRDRRYHVAWNVLEDQRMETMVVADSPRIGNYFTLMVAKLVLNGTTETAWMYLAGREYFPTAIRRQAYREFNAHMDKLGVANASRTWYGLVCEYREATDPLVILDIIKRAAEFIESTMSGEPQGVDNHDRMRTRSGYGDDTNPPEQGNPGEANNPGELDEFDGEGGEGQGEQNEGESDQDGPGKGKGEGEKQDDGTDARPQRHLDEQGDDTGRDSDGTRDQHDPNASAKENPLEGQSLDDMDFDGPTGQSNRGEAGEVFAPQSLSEKLSSVISDALDATRNDNDTKEIVSSAFESADSGQGLPDYPGSGETMQPEIQAEADVIAAGMTSALETFVTANQPVWRSRVEHGIIDPLAYRTKNVGDRDFRRQFDDVGEMGLDVHVSVLCDVSYSMAYNMTALSQVLYGVGTACQALDIGTTFTLWSSGNENFRLWSDGEVAPTVFPAMGGTDPTAALDDMVTHNTEGATNHLVIVFTDGEWGSGFPSLARWGGNDRTIVYVKYGYEGGFREDRGADRHIHISNVLDLAKELEWALHDVLAESLA
jgi:hypothetical protein